MVGKKFFASTQYLKFCTGFKLGINDIEAQKALNVQLCLPE